ncbi:MAG: hypothetical protein ABI806_14470 [Candidatus Solibacter sp.]
MPDDDFGRFQKELAALREQMKRELSEHRAQVAAALDTGGEAGVLRLKVAEWEYREKLLGEKIAAKNVEYQALRARAEQDNHRLQMRIGDLEKLLAQREGEIASLKPVLESLAAECERRPISTDEELVAELRGQVTSAREECERLQQAMDNSLALKAARTIGRLLGKGAR